jgi:L-fuculose-phosphate aldolase
MASTERSDADLSERQARQEVLDTAVAMSRRGLSPGRSGNVSRRWCDGMLITPSGVAYQTMLAEDIVRVDAAGAAADGQGKPSTEAPFHLAVYAARPDVGGIVHSHAMHATVLACAHRNIPAFHYMVAMAGGNDIPCIPYATFGSIELSKRVADGLKNRNACLMANHGMIAIAATCAAALDLAAEVETLSEQYYKVLTLGMPYILDDTEMLLILDKFRNYGQGLKD